MIVIDKPRVFTEAERVLNRAASWLAGSESAQAGALWLHTLTLSLFCVLLCLTWVLCVAGMSVCNYFNLTISCEVCGRLCVHVYVWLLQLGDEKADVSLHMMSLCTNTHHMFNRSTYASV